ncbi:unnamed protein product [Owenia fusiformis]|uniref:Uncharacterized protein n=1 Tax=Owenia fusiformis TaxID=6347 RepID=A0A8J1XGR0_OWEFU|nr:unnamed protein product [Owenia fusiformis]
MQAVGLISIVMAMMVVVTSAAPMKVAKAKGCRGLAKYRLTVETEWSKVAFPKQFPLYRPHAQWSKLIGRTHSSKYSFWSVGALASEGVKEFAETGRTRVLDGEPQGYDGVLDVFYAPPIQKGVGQTHVKVLVDATHSKVSFMVKLIPSPDWFIGLDSTDLCQEGKWAEYKKFDLGPVDGGTDKGYTFSAPNWPSIPPQAIHKMNASFPNHPANSFYYPGAKKLPRLGVVFFEKVGTYDSNGKELDDELKDNSNEAADNTEQRDEVIPNLKAKMDEEAKQGLRQKIVLPYKPGTEGVIGGFRVRLTTKTTPSVLDDKQTDVKSDRFKAYLTQTGNEEDMTQTDVSVILPAEDYNPIRPYEKDTPDQKVEGQELMPLDCNVSPWGSWSPCSKTCGFGEHTRHRYITEKPQNGGASCPPLQETKTCGSMRSCSWNHFQSGIFAKKQPARRPVNRKIIRRPVGHPPRPGMRRRKVRIGYRKPL